MEFIGENKYGFDANSLGFPSILGCQAICFQTSRGLYGFHDAKSGTSGARAHLTPLQVSDDKLRVFAGWVGSQLQRGETGVAVYGVINRDEQYSPNTQGNTDWKNVLLGLANALTFTGGVYGARVASHVEKKGSIYVQFDLAGTTVTSGFKRWSKMDVDVHNKVATTNQGQLNPSGATFVAAPLFGSGKVAPVVRKDAGKGFNLNRIAQVKFFKFQ